MKEKWSIGDANKSQVFILPLIGEIDKDFAGSRLPQSQFRNCFVGDKDKGIEDRILLLYKFDSSTLYLEFEDSLTKHPLFDGQYEVDKNHTIFIFKVPDDKYEDYNKLIKGQYSKISPQLKDHILNFHGIKKESNTGGVLFLGEEKRNKLEEQLNFGLPSRQWIKIPIDAELDSPFDEEIEYFQNKYKVKTIISPSEEFQNKDCE